MTNGIRTSIREISASIRRSTAFRVSLILVAVTGLVLAAGPAIAAATSVSWTDGPPEMVEDGDEFTVSVTGDVDGDGEVCLVQSGYFSYSDCRDVSNSFSESFTVNADDDLGIGPGEETELHVEVEDDGWWGTESDTTTTEAIGVEPTTDVEWSWSGSPPATVEYGETFTAEVTGEVEDQGEVCLEESGFGGYSNCADVSDSFTESFTIDSVDDLGLDPGDSTDLHGTVEEDGWWGTESDTTTTEAVEMESIPDEISWSITPPDEISDGGAFVVEFYGSTSSAGDVCVEESGWGGYGECESVEVGDFTVDFTVSSSDLGLEPGEETSLLGTSPGDETSTQSVGVEPATYVEWEGAGSPPATVEYGETFTTEVTGEVEDEGEVCLEESGFGGYGACRDVSGSFTESFTIDSVDDLGLGPGDSTDLHGAVEEDGWWGTESDTTTTETVEMESVPDDLDWSIAPPDEIDENEDFTVEFTGSTSEAGDVCLEEPGFGGYGDCESVGVGDFTVSFTVADSDLGLDSGEEADLIGVSPTAETSERSVGVVPATFVEWEETPPVTVEHGETAEVTLTGEVDKDGELRLRESGLLDSTLESTAVSGEFTETFEIDASEYDPGDELELYGELEESGWWGTESDTTTTQVLEIADVADDLDWSIAPPDEIDEDENFTVELTGSTSEAGDVCLEEPGFGGYGDCESVGVGDFTVSFSVAADDLGLAPGDETELYGTSPTVETTERSVGVAPATVVEWEESPPEEIRHGEAIEVTLTGEVDGDGELRLRESGLLDSTLGSESVSGEFTETFEIDTAEYEPGDELELYGDVEESGWWGTETDRTETETMTVSDISDEISWDPQPPEEIEPDGTITVGVTGTTSEAGDVCLEETGFGGFSDCRSVEVGNFEYTLTIDAAEFGADPGDELTVQATAPNDETEPASIEIAPATVVEWVTEPPETTGYGDTFEVTVSGEVADNGEFRFRESGLLDRTLASTEVSGEFTETVSVETTDFDPGDEVELYGAVEEDGWWGTESDTTERKTVEIGDRAATELAVDLPAETDGDTVIIEGRLVEEATGDTVANQPVDLVAAGTILDEKLASATTNEDGEFSVRWEADQIGDDESVNVFLRFENESSSYDATRFPEEETYPIRVEPEVEVFDFDVAAVWSSQVLMEENTTKLYLVPMSEDGFETDPPRHMPEVELTVDGLPEEAYEIDRPEDQLLTTFPLTTQRAPGYAASVEIDASELGEGAHAFAVEGTTSAGNFTRSYETTVRVVDDTETGARSVAFDSFNRTTDPYWWSDTSLVTVLEETGIEDPTTYTLDKTSSMLKDVHKKKGLISPLKVLYETYDNRVVPLLGSVEDMETAALLAESANESETNITEFQGRLGDVEHHLNEGNDAEAADAIDETLVELREWRVTLEATDAQRADSKEVALEQLETLEEYLVSERQQLEPEDASITVLEEPDGEFLAGENVETTVEVTNTGDEPETFFVGYSAFGPHGNDFDNDGTTGTTVTLEPDESETVTVSWTVEEESLVGEFELLTTVWLESDRHELKTRLDGEFVENSIEVVPPEDGDPVFEAEFETAPDEDLEVGDEFPMVGYVENVGNGPGTVTVDVVTNDDVRKSTTVDLDPGEGVEEPLTIELQEPGQTDIDLVVRDADGITYEETVTVTPADEALVAEELHIESPTSDDPAVGPDDDIIVVNTTVEYSGEISPEEVFDASEVAVLVDGEEATIAGVDRAAIDCTGTDGVDCPTELRVEIAAEVPADVDGVSDLTVLAEVPGGTDLEESRVLDRTEADSVRLEAPVRISSTPSDANVTIDGEDVGRTPVELERLPSDEVTITIDKNGYEPEEITTAIPTDIGVELQERSSDSDLQVVDNEFTAQTVGETVELTAEVTVKNGGEEDGEKTVELFVDGQPVDERTVFVEADGTGTATLVTEFSEPGVYDVRVTDREPELVEIELDDSEGEGVTVEVVETNAPITKGEQLNVTAAVENTGNETETQDIEILVGETTVDSETVTLEGGESMTVNLTYVTVEDDEIPIEITSEDDTESTTIPVADPPQGAVFDVSLEQYDDVTAGDDVNVSAAVENIGDTGATKTVNLTVDEEVVDSRTVELIDNQTKTVFLTWETSAEDIGTTELTVSTEDDSASSEVIVGASQAEAFFNVEIVDAPDEVFLGDDLTVNATIENLGGTEATQDVTLTINGNPLTAKSVELGGEEKEEITLTWNTSDAAPDDHELGVETANDTDAVPLTITVPDDPSFDVAIVDGETDGSVAPGDELTVTANVTNTGDLSGSRDVDFYAGGEYVETESDLKLGPGSSTDIAFAYTVPEELESDELSVTVESEASETASSITVEAPEEEIPFMPPPSSDDESLALGDIDAPGTVDPGESLTVSVTVENIAETQIDDDVVLTVGDSVVSETDISLKGGGETTVEYDLEAPSTTGDHQLTVETSEGSTSATLTVDADESEDDTESDPEPETDEPEGDDGNETGTDERDASEDDGTGRAESNDEDDVLYEISDGSPGFGLLPAVVVLLGAGYLLRTRTP